MITQEENDLLCLVEGAVPMGTIMRQHWVPACMSEEVAERDGKPARVRLLGEDLVVFRDSEGRLGAIDEFCRHRGASLAFGRNENCGLRCLYHGWKFDVNGNVMEMPSEPDAGEALKAEAKLKSIPRGIRRLCLAMDGRCRKRCRVRATRLGARAGRKDLHRKNSYPMQLGAGSGRVD